MEVERNGERNRYSQVVRRTKSLRVRKIVKNPRYAVKLFLRFLQCMSLRDIHLLLTSSEMDHSRQRV